MNQKLVLSLVLVLAGSFATYFYFAARETGPGASTPEAAGDVPVSAKVVNVEEMSAPSTGNQEAAAQGRRAAMESAYSSLEELRKELKSRANLLKSRVWGLEMPPEEAKLITHAMKRSYVYLKNPAMLGAYFEIGDIQREMRRVRAMLDELEEVDSLISKYKEGSAD